MEENLLSTQRMVGSLLIIMLSKVGSALFSLEHWLFNTCGNDAETVTAIYSVIEIAKSNQMKPHQYLRHICTILPTTIDKIKALLLWRLNSQERG